MTGGGTNTSKMWVGIYVHVTLVLLHESRLPGTPPAKFWALSTRAGLDVDRMLEMCTSSFACYLKRVLACSRNYSRLPIEGGVHVTRWMGEDGGMDSGGCRCAKTAFAGAQFLCVVELTTFRIMENMPTGLRKHHTNLEIHRIKKKKKNEMQVRQLVRSLPSVEDMRRCIASKAAEKHGPESNVADGSTAGASSSEPTEGGAREPRAASPVGRVVAGAIAAYAAAVHGVTRSAADSSAAAGSGEAGAVGGPGAGICPREEVSPELKRISPLVYPLLQWLLAK